jgi:enoyl-CoA hydratase/carnithine racemase
MDLSAIEVLHPRLDEERRLLVLELDHGKANEMGTEQLTAFEALCELVEGTDAVSCICTTSRRVSKKGKSIFIAGANVTERTGWSNDQVRAHVVRQRTLMERLRRLPVYDIVLASGVTLGWGVEYVLTGDYCIATQAASFALPETGLGIIPGARGTAELAHLVGPAHALRLGCTGESIGVAEALRIGLVQESTTDVDTGMSRVEAIADMLARRSPTAIASFKQALLDGLGRPSSDRLALERAAYEHTVDTGEAAIGRENFAAIREGKIPPWGPRKIAKGVG